MMSRLIVLAGNPNVGKSRLFSRLTGHYAEISNFPGTTVEVQSAPFMDGQLMDSPGVYGLGRFSQDESVALDTILKADVVINVVDATHLPRDLFLTLQLVELGKPLCLVLNMMDALEDLGAEIDVQELSRQLQIPVVPISAKMGQNIDALREVLRGAIAVPGAREKWAPVPDVVGRIDALLFLEEDPEVLKRVGIMPPVGSRERVYLERCAAADRLAQAVWKPPASDSLWQQKLDDIVLHPVWGFVILGLLLLLLYYGMGVVVAGVVVNAGESFLKSEVVQPLEAMSASWLGSSTLSYRLLFGQYGMIRAGLVAVVGLLLPLVTAFNLLLALLEGTGYLPRLAVLLDRFFINFGLNGRAVIPIVLGFGCVTMATLSTRVLATPRERSIATTLLAWTIPCSAQMGVVVGLMSGLGPLYALSYTAIILGLFVAVGTVMDWALPGEATPLFLDMPAWSWPSISDMLVKTEGQVREFLREATPLFLLGTGLIEVAHLVGMLERINRALAPVFQNWLGLPRQATAAFVLGFIRRDFGVAEFYQFHLSPHQILTGSVTLTLFVPCIASTLVILKERGILAGTVIWGGSIAIALCCGIGVAHWWPI
ncbi:MAG: ferrous iron transport protein B [Sulfobacillus benefaciens]|uniref:Ferrous iron transport protein B n=1 Tax=Sulfobacillus benefaciens TaxID=453960 RepID=A0A2T2XK27_9FIRM|nr:MAG: ferrous iron transport protein B [Sulfobacillus benefaciens]